MSLTLIQALFRTLTSLTDVDLKLLKYKENSEDDMEYTSQTIRLNPPKLLSTLLGDIQVEYAGRKKRLERYAAVEEYDGSMVGTTIYYLECTKPLIETAYKNLTVSLANPQTEGNPVDFHANAYVLEGEWSYEEKMYSVKLFALMNPLKKLKHKFAYDGETFREIAQDVLDLRVYMDVVVIGERVYFLGMAGEKLFGMERAYRANVQQLAEGFSKVPFLRHADALQRIALSGHYPRMLVAYQESKMKYLEDIDHRQEIAEKFSIDIEDDGSVNMENTENADKLIRFLCNKGMLDPINQDPMSVVGAKAWAV